MSIRSRARALIPTALRPAARFLYHRAYRLGLRLDWWVKDHLENDPTLPPARLRFRVGESSDPQIFLDVGRRTAENVHSSLEAAGFVPQPGCRALDFGCGCGRTMRWLVQSRASVQWSGCDVDAEAIAWCRAHLPGRFEVNRPLPPLPFADASFDLVICVSVFTHLDEHVQRDWSAELRRVTKPSGAVLLSLYAEHVWRATPDAPAVESGAFVFKRSTKLRGIVPEGYHTAFQNRDRMRRMLMQAGFSTVRFVDGGFGDHDAVVATGD